MTAILTQDPPDLAQLQSLVPPHLARIVTRCLEKRPEARFQSASDLYTVPALGGKATRLTEDKRALNPVWTAKEIVFADRHSLAAV